MGLRGNEGEERAGCITVEMREINTVGQNSGASNVNLVNEVGWRLNIRRHNIYLFIWPKKRIRCLLIETASCHNLLKSVTRYRLLAHCAVPGGHKRQQSSRAQSSAAAAPGPPRPAALHWSSSQKHMWPCLWPSVMQPWFTMKKLISRFSVQVLLIW